MKMKFLNISITLFVTFFLSCSESTAPEDTPPLGEYLNGTYVDVLARHQPDSNNSRIYTASSTSSTYLTLNSNSSYNMRLELYVELLDTVFNIIQNGSYITSETQYVKSDHVLGSSHWKGMIEFRPEGATNWGGSFEIHRWSLNLVFTPNHVFIELPNSIGGIIVYKWYRNRRP